MNAADLPQLRGTLLRWYDRSQRDLPWRVGLDQPDPYRVWLSEMMLQQTRVETVKPYYHRWLQRFPTLASLADAPLDDVLKEWEGLGYYSRARNFHRAAGEVRANYGGEVPADPVRFRTLPGVGRYTAGAVMSIAFGLEEPVVDGNVRRVFARLLDDPAPAEAELWSLAEALVRGERPGSLNQAVMELGATVCTPRGPRCDECPVASFCAARAAGTQSQRPAARSRGPLPREEHVAAVLEVDGRLLLARRPGGGRLGGMWEFPGGPLRPGEDAEPALARVLQATLEIDVAARAEICVVDHAFTHVRVRYRAFRAALLGGAPTPVGYDATRWVLPGELRELALPRAQQRIASLVAPSPEVRRKTSQG